MMSKKRLIKHIVTVLLASGLALVFLPGSFAQTSDIVFPVKDIFPGSGGSSPSDLTSVDGTLFFVADDGKAGRELWKSDGTEAGTVLVKDIVSGSDSSSPAYLTNVNGTLFFSADDGSTGQELWKSDGTEAGTVLVKDIAPDSNSSSPDGLTEMNGILFFAADDGSTGRELWKSDGTEAGTVLVKDVVGGLSPESLTEVNGILFFSTRELWKSDGTAAGTVLVKDIFPEGGSSSPRHLTDVNGTLFFSAFDGSNGRELWKSDGTEAGTILVKDIFPGIYQGTYGNSSSPQSLTDVDGTLFFSAGDGTRGLWKSDGTEAGTVLLKSGAASGHSIVWPPAHLTNVNGTLFFSTWTELYYEELWKSDGTPEGTVLVDDIAFERSSSPAHLTNLNGTLYFSAYHWFLNLPSDTGRELWKSDGTREGTVLVKDIVPGISDSSPADLTNVNGKLFFTADDGIRGRELWALIQADKHFYLPLVFKR